MANQEIDDFLTLDENEISKIVDNLDRLIPKQTNEEIEKTEVVETVREEPEEAAPEPKKEETTSAPEKREPPERKPPKRREPERREPERRPVPSQDDDEDATTYLSQNDTMQVTLKDLRTGKLITVTDPFYIGKNKSNDLCIHETVISRRHAEIHEQNGKVYIKDLGSLNGTFLNNVKLPPNVDIEARSGQEVIFANQRYRIEF